MVNLSNTVPPLIHKWSKAISLMNPKLMADFYCENAVLVGTYSKPYEIGKPEILKYFQDFLDNDSILNLINKKSLVVNKFYWYNEPYCGGDCNEMISCSGKQIFKDFNQLYLSEKYISQQLDYHYGERVTGRHINNLIEKSVIDNVLVFDFDYRVIR